MSARLLSLGDDGIGARTFQATCQGRRGDHRNHDDTRLFQRPNISSGVSRACGQHGHPFLYGKSYNSIDVEAEKGDVHPVGLGRSPLDLLDLLAHPIGRRVSGTQYPESAGFGHRYHQLPGGNPGHASLHDGMRDAEQLRQCRLEH